MAGKKNTEKHIGSSTNKSSAQGYYKLKTDAVDRLVNAEKKTYPKSNADPGKQYRSGALSRIPNWIKVLFIKFWFSGAVCFFIFWGLGLYVTNMLDMIVILAVVLGMVTDILVNNALRFSENFEGQNSRWMMFSKKKFWTFFANIIYAFIVLICVIWFYNIINVIANSMMGTEDKVFVAVEPILFGLLYMLFDMCFIGIKNTAISIVSDAKRKNGI